MNSMIAIVAAYLIGSVSFAVVVSRLFGLSDPRTYGSKNPGATNVLRTGNKAAAALTLLGDGFKGWLAVWLAQTFQNQYDLSDSVVAMVGLAAFIGHLWPVFFKFEGGKGVATALGVLIGLNVWLGLGTFVTWLVVAYAFRYSSLAALIASLFAPFYYGLLFGARVELLAVVIMSALLIYRHRQNIANLMAGKESRIGSKAKKPAEDKDDHAHNHAHGKKAHKKH
ncbi:glycerol-3-phosphate 1-O-acyltransferase PlsY [Undibacterium cyanobacteriorum]|uniref:Glycerol-3-phosphate acyltransferase n=1 Tax=Undibacterium cyanobacteriorum TaxID=3073561 RepID=A0ABY9RGB0_9BURK|nr:glycerol-3-phosphate 1-O-acyltransferase PlsY [Undibacterium sp. 20NA77.5]WMW79704.1 glycerol-3-phosphate 1-O-acyltransferase PlsY [Undibacterium sp. 20NA77.5]